MIDVSLFLVILIYLLVCLIYLLILICLVGDSKLHSKCNRNFENIFNRTKDISKPPRWVKYLSRWFITLCLTVLYANPVTTKLIFPNTIAFKGTYYTQITIKQIHSFRSISYFVWSCCGYTYSTRVRIPGI